VVVVLVPLAPARTLLGRRRVRSGLRRRLRRSRSRGRDGRRGRARRWSRCWGGRRRRLRLRLGLRNGLRARLHCGRGERRRRRRFRLRRWSRSRRRSRLGLGSRRRLRARARRRARGGHRCRRRGPVRCRARRGRGAPRRRARPRPLCLRPDGAFRADASGAAASRGANRPAPGAGGRLRRDHDRWQPAARHSVLRGLAPDCLGREEPLGAVRVLERATPEVPRCRSGRDEAGQTQGSPGHAHRLQYRATAGRPVV
jgi:hypothetical protein